MGSRASESMERKEVIVMINLWLRAVVKLLMTLEIKLRIRWIR